MKYTKLNFKVDEKNPLIISLTLSAQEAAYSGDLVCRGYMYPPWKYIRFSELPSLLSKKFRDAYEFSNEKSGYEKREKNKFFL